MGLLKIVYLESTFVVVFEIRMNVSEKNAMNCVLFVITTFHKRTKVNERKKSVRRPDKYNNNVTE